jgi:hypothetical protein
MPSGGRDNKATPCRLGTSNAFEATPEASAVVWVVEEAAAVALVALGDEGSSWSSWCWLGADIIVSMAGRSPNSIKDVFCMDAIRVFYRKLRYGIIPAYRLHFGK